MPSEAMIEIMKIPEAEHKAAISILHAMLIYNKAGRGDDALWLEAIRTINRETHCGEMRKALGQIAVVGELITNDSKPRQTVSYLKWAMEVTRIAQDALTPS